ncbi:MAG TPA: hypothetical protein VI753_03945, partial [Anaerolineales bacterium]|nr:hypothetical protein [Anaerolineales bacterium]
SLVCKSPVISLLTCVVFLALATPIQAGTIYTWDGSDSSLWTAGGNWSGGSAPTLATDEIVFYATGATNLATSLNGTSYSINSLTFNSTATSNVTLAATGAETLTIGAGGVSVSSATHNVYISAPVVLGATQTWTISSSAASYAMSVTGVISGVGFNLTN